MTFLENVALSYVLIVPTYYLVRENRVSNAIFFNTKIIYSWKRLQLEE